MFGKSQDEKDLEAFEKKAQEEVEEKKYEEIRSEQRRDYVDEKMKLSEKELFVELLYRMDELLDKTDWINKYLLNIQENTKPSNQPDYQFSKY
jgi:hypothetical protein